jgi:peptidoglycan/LPS O-acetylase OafA/YrhL
VGRGHIPALSGLRAIAALSVFFCHACRRYFGADVPNDPMGVMLFFVLSGFLMAWLYLDLKPSGANVAAYARARFGRIYPLFAVAVIGAATLFAIDPDFPYRMTGSETVKHLLLAGTDVRTLWTVSIEVQFYAIFVLLWSLYWAIGRHRKLGLGLVCAAVIVVFLVLEGGPLSIERGGLLFWGVIAALVYRQMAGSTWLHALGTLCPLLMAGYFALLLIPFSPAAYEFVPLQFLIAATVLSSACASGWFVERFLGSERLAWLGNISFGVYLLHRPAMYFVSEMGGDVLPGTVQLVAVLALTLTLSQVAHVWIEKPARSALRGRTNAPSLKPAFQGR